MDFNSSNRSNTNGNEILLVDRNIFLTLNFNSWGPNIPCKIEIKLFQINIQGVELGIAGNDFSIKRLVELFIYSLKMIPSGGRLLRE